MRPTATEGMALFALMLRVMARVAWRVAKVAEPGVPDGIDGTAAVMPRRCALRLLNHRV